MIAGQMASVPAAILEAHVIPAGTIGAVIKRPVGGGCTAWSSSQAIQRYPVDHHITERGRIDFHLRDAVGA